MTIDKRDQLQRLLAGYRPIDAPEAQHLARLRSLIESPGDPFSRLRFEPGHVTVSAFVRSRSGRDLLMIHHARLGRWLQPGGHVEKTDPDLVSAARREVAEETGLDAVTADGPDGVAFDLDVHPIPARADEPAHLHFDVRFALRARSDELLAGHEVRGARWVALDDVPAVDPAPSTARVLRKLRALAGH